MAQFAADCPREEALAALASHRSTIHSYLGITDRAGQLEVRVKASNPECEGGAGCVRGNVVRSSQAIDEHELVHAYLAPHATPPAIWREGLAVALDCSIDYPTSRDFDVRNWDGSLYRPAYGSSGALVSFLIRRGGIERFMQLYLHTPADATAEQITQSIVDAYGFSYGDALIASQRAASQCLAVWRCAGGVPICAGAVERTGQLVEIAAPTILSLKGDQHTQTCDGFRSIPHGREVYMSSPLLWTSTKAPPLDELPYVPGPLEPRSFTVWDFIPEDTTPVSFTLTRALTLTSLDASACVELETCADNVCTRTDFDAPLTLVAGAYTVRYVRRCLDVFDPRLQFR